MGNLYSCTPQGDDLQRLTHHRAYYVRYPQTDGRRIVYQSGGDLYVLDPQAGSPARVDIQYHSPRLWRGARYVSPSRYLNTVALHPKGHSLVATVRGRPFTMGLFEGGVVQHGQPQGVRYRLTCYTKDGSTLIAVSDEGGEEGIELLPLTSEGEAKRFDDPKLGRVLTLLPSPDGTTLALTNHRQELLLLDVASGDVTVVDRSHHDRLDGVDWSKDSMWVAYGFPISGHLAVIKLLDVQSGETHTITESKFRDTSPHFDPEGRYLYFLSKRAFNPVYDGIQFELGFPQGMRLCLVTLRADVEHPFIPKPRPLSGEDDDTKGDTSKDDAAKDEKGDAQETSDNEGDGTPSDDDKGPDDEERLKVDLEGIASRVLAFPVAEGQFGHVEATAERVFVTRYPVKGALLEPLDERSSSSGEALLLAWDLKAMELKEVASGISGFALGQERKVLVLQAGNAVRVVASTLEASSDTSASDGPGRKSGWVDLERISVRVDPVREWEQMLREAWRLMRDHFWTEDMSGIDWDAAYARYQPLIERVSTRSEFSDLMWELQGELGTSHAYEIGGDYPSSPTHYKGALGADFSYHEATGGYQITHIVRGDVWDPSASSPLARAGVDVSVGDVLVALGGRSLSRELSVDQLLVNQSNSWVTLTLVDGQGEHRRDVTVKTLHSDNKARYRDWVEANARKVAEATDGRVGYVHIPDMGP
ncbi:MAG: PDZ domain-containing protein, partial [Myxococcota bacterium]